MKFVAPLRMSSSPGSLRRRFRRRRGAGREGGEMDKKDQEFIGYLVMFFGLMLTLLVISLVGFLFLD